MDEKMWSPVAQARTLREVLAEAGQRVSRRRSDAPYLERVAEAAELISDVLSGHRPSYLLMEAMSTSDFPNLMGDVLDRQLLGRYAETPTTWSNYAKRGLVRDFRSVSRFALDGLEGRYTSNYEKPELTEPREDNGLTETEYTYSVKVYEKAAALNWRMLINDDLDAFADIPARLARGARRTEEYFATSLFVGASGPHTSMYTAGNKNIVTSNPPLTVAALQTAMTILAAQVDGSGEPITIESVELVVPPALEITALNILNATQLTIDPNASAGTAQQVVTTQNWLRGRLRLSVNPYIPVIASTANGATSWFLFANPNTGRPALEVGFLRGYEQPGLYQKAPNTVRVGGGAVDPMLGDFDTGEIRYKGMHIIGGTRLDPKATVASNGSGS